MSAVKDRRKQRQHEQQQANRERRESGDMLPWQEAKLARRKQRQHLKGQGLLPQQQRSPNGFIVKQTSTGTQLVRDTKLAHQNAMYRTQNEYDERPAKQLEARKAKQKAASARKNKPKPGKVTTRKQAKE